MDYFRSLNDRIKRNKGTSVLFDCYNLFVTSNTMNAIRSTTGTLLTRDTMKRIYQRFVSTHSLPKPPVPVRNIFPMSYFK
jgi:hypothetical protein